MLERIKEYYGKYNNQEAVKIIKALQEKFGEPNIEHESIPQFTHEDAEKLIQKGFHIFTLTGKNLNELATNFEVSPFSSFSKKFGKHIFFDPQGLSPNEHSISSEVAVFTEPRKILLNRSSRKTYPERLKRVSEYSRSLQKELDTKHLKAIMGNIPDYVELAFLFKKQTDKQLFNFKSYCHIFVETRDTVKRGYRAIIGQSGRSGYSPNVYDDFYPSNERHGNVFVYPIIVPSK